MRAKTTNLQTRLYLISGIILLVGLSSSLWIYLTAGNDSQSVLGYEIVGGNAYLVTPENSKKYVHDLKLMGGNAAVFADEISRWFIGLWHGEALAVTVACIAVFISLGCFFAARTSPPGQEPDAPAEHKPVENK
ncbi:MAG: hypothetical protein HZB31_02495 [Nitrospirae bacterium]|nr:hypothetical protein [Nitrospirota bacterium]